jgi:hypothetical protein
MTPETAGKDEKGPTGLPYVNDPGKQHPAQTIAQEAGAEVEDLDVDHDDTSYGEEE